MDEIAPDFLIFNDNMYVLKSKKIIKKSLINDTKEIVFFEEGTGFSARQFCVEGFATGDWEFYLKNGNVYFDMSKDGIFYDTVKCYCLSCSNDKIQLLDRKKEWHILN